ncbi:MAG: hypothetical protein JKX73_10530 [Flavobacteriales bacterium]|nr:hypothetical protein [Flavobacteriales bacterium]
MTVMLKYLVTMPLIFVTTVMSSGTLQNPISVIGVIQSSGVSKNMKATYKLENSEFQILSNSGNYILEGTNDFSSYWGKCIEIKVILKPIWDSTNKLDHVFGRKVLDIISIKEKGLSNCEYLPDNTKEKFLEYMQSKYTGIKLESHKGYLKRANRPAPDIGNDYALELDETITEYNGNYEGGSKQLSVIGISCLNNEMYEQYEKCIKGKIHIELEGYLVGGHGHVSVFKVASITER